jgi:hypothetical protein
MVGTERRAAYWVNWTLQSLKKGPLLMKSASALSGRCCCDLCSSRYDFEHARWYRPRERDDCKTLVEFFDLVGRQNGV